MSDVLCKLLQAGPHLAADHDDLGQLRPQRRHRAVVAKVAHIGGQVHEVADEPHDIVEPHRACARTSCCQSGSARVPGELSCSCSAARASR